MAGSGSKERTIPLARIFITGSTDGLGLATARTLVNEGHEILLHARSGERAVALNGLAPQAAGIVIGDLSSGMQHAAGGDLSDLDWTERRWSAGAAYSESKLHVSALAASVARHWPTVLSNSVDPGWVPTKMGGAGAPDNLAMGQDTQSWLAVSDDPAALVSGKHFHHRRQRTPAPEVTDH